MSDDNVILITGCPRSGTSMTAGVINICGAWGGDMQDDTYKQAKKAMYENQVVRSEVKSLLEDMGVDPKGQNPLPDIKEVFKFADVFTWRALFYLIMKRQGYKDESLPLMYKGAKMCLIWPLWHKAFPNAKWVLVRRRSEDIVYSCLRTGFMSAYKDKEGWLFWVREHMKLFKQMFEAGLNIREVFPQEMINGNFIEIESVINWLGLEWKEEEVKKFISPELWGKENG